MSGVILENGLIEIEQALNSFGNPHAELDFIEIHDAGFWSELGVAGITYFQHTKDGQTLFGFPARLGSKSDQLFTFHRKGRA